MNFKSLLILCLISFYGLQTDAQNRIIGSEFYIHLEQIDGIWWLLVNADGEKFISTGMNHMADYIRFAPHNHDFWSEKFGGDILSNDKVNWHAEHAIKKWMDQTAKDHKDYHFNTIAFHRPMQLPDVYFNELGIYYLGKIKTAQIHANRVRKLGVKFPDVFSAEFKKHAESVSKNYCSKHKGSKYLIGYTYDDLPSYSFEVYNKRLKYSKKDKNGLEFHPWVLDLINVDQMTAGKQVWIDILKEHYSSPQHVALNYNLNAYSWKEIAQISNWKRPDNIEKWIADQTEMSKRIIEKWHQINRDAILKYDPNHLILGDKISCHGNGHPDWVYEIAGKYVDVLLIQDFEFFKPSHVKKLNRFYKLSGKPILNGDHAYGYTTPEMEKAKGIPVESHAAIGEEYTTYLKGIMNLPYMVGWLYCGYLEQWKGGNLDNTGKQQTGMFDPFGNPRSDALEQVKKANKEAILWHENAGKNDLEFSKRNLKY
ncbi:hypothetical protein [Seonamhaeicola sp.]|uniref:hypothetical protein n=1 Tax=Seonamhaeicola sp. TaxID=1912245 RepID=UPI002622D7B0|nr:hypothetical protein [Seonamhaeicola sp.]